MSSDEDRRLLEALELATGCTHAIEATQRLVNAWRASEQRHEERVTKLEVRAKALDERCIALTALRDELQHEVSENRLVLEDQLQARRARQLAETSGLDAAAADFIRASKLLIQPGKKITDSTLRAIGITPPARRSRPTEHLARQLATFVLPALGFEILRSQSAHPDLICRYEGQVVGVEIEVALSDYDAHGHDSADAHVVACWTIPDQRQLHDGFYFVPKITSPGFSPPLAVIPLQLARMWGAPLSVGKKRLIADPTQERAAV